VFSEQTATFALYNINSLVFITDVESVYSAVRTESFYNILVGTFRLYRVKIHLNVCKIRQLHIQFVDLHWVHCRLK
jgi:hypothetical protein